MIKAVIFDVDGVLIDSFEANLKFYQDLLIKNGFAPPSRETFLNMNHLAMMDAIRIFTKSKDEGEIKKIWQMGKDRTTPYPIDLLKIPKNLESVITKLSKKYILAIVTNRVRDGVFSIPQLFKYKDFFKTVVYYEDTVKHKPDPEPLLLALKKLVLKSNEAIYIGDAPSDIKAAKEAKMKVIAYSKLNIPDSDVVTSSFEKLPDLIETLSSY